MPITVLIGTVFVMARLAQSSEFTILRTSGLGPFKALRLLLELGLVFVVFTFAVGDYLSPAASRQGQLLKAKYLGVTISHGASGAWLKESQDDHSSVVNVAALGNDGQLAGVRIFQFDDKGRLIGMMMAAQGSFSPDGQSWLLRTVRTDSFKPLGRVVQRSAASGESMLEIGRRLNVVAQAITAHSGETAGPPAFQDLAMAEGLAPHEALELVATLNRRSENFFELSQRVVATAHSAAGAKADTKALAAPAGGRASVGVFVSVIHQQEADDEENQPARPARRGRPLRRD
jgi:lipopolysaccharide export LptBFGC system permease protein LptF